MNYHKTNLNIYIENNQLHKCYTSFLLDFEWSKECISFAIFFVVKDSKKLDLSTWGVNIFERYLFLKLILRYALYTDVIIMIYIH